MSTLKQAAQVDGQTISNLDPDMVITLDSHEGVQISSKTEDTITYQFLKEVDQDTEYKLNLTFVYKDQYKTVVPMTFLNKKPQPKFNLNVEWITKDEELKPAEGNYIYFKVTDDAGTPVSGVTLKNLKAVGSPNTPDLVPAYAGRIVDTKPDGVYAVSVSLGHLSGSFSIDMTLSKDGFDFVIPKKTYKTPGTPGKFTFTPNKVFATDGPTEIEIFGTQDKYTKPNSPLQGTFVKLEITGGMVADLSGKVTLDADGKGKITIIPNGKVENINIYGTFSATPDNRLLSVDHDIIVEKDTLTVELLTDEDLGYLKKATVVAHVLNSKGEYLHQPGKIVNSTITSVPTNDVVSNVPGEFTQGTADTSIYTMIIDVGYLPGTVTIIPELTIAGVKYDIDSKLEFKTEGSPVTVSRVGAVIDPFKSTMMGIFFTRQVRIDGETSISFGTTVVSQKSSDGLKIDRPYTFLGKGNATGYISSEQPNTTQTLTFSVSEEIQGILYTYDDLVLEVTVRDGVKEEVTATPQADLEIMQVDPENTNRDLPCYLEFKLDNNVKGPVTDAELVSVKTTNIPETGSGIFSVGESLTKVADNIYRLDIKCDKGIDSALFDLVIKSGEKEFTVKQFSVNIIKPPLRLEELVPISMLPQGGSEVDFKFSLMQASWTGLGTNNPVLIYNSKLQFTYDDFTISDNAEFVNEPAQADKNPTMTVFKLKSKAADGTVKITGTVNAVNPKLGKQGTLEISLPIGIGKELTLVPVSDPILTQGDNKVVFDLNYADGAPATGLTCYYYDFSDGEKRNNGYTGYSHLKEDKDKPGRYESNIAVGWAQATFTPIWYMDVDGLSSKVVSQPLTTQGTEPEVVQTDNTITNDDKQYTTYFQLEVPLVPGPQKYIPAGKCELISVDNSLTIIGSITREPSNGRFIIKCEPKGETGIANIKVKFTCTEFMTTYVKEIDLVVNINPPTPVLTDLVTEYTFDLWEEKELSYDVKSGDVSVASSVTDIVCTNNDDIKDDFEFSKNANGKWVFKSIKSDTSDVISKKAELKFIVVYAGITTELTAEVQLSTNVNANPKPEFDVEII